MTRAQFVTWLYKAALASGDKSAQAIEAADATQVFADVPATRFYAKAVAWAAESGITSKQNTSFNPNAVVTRAQAVTMLWQYKDGAETVSAEVNWMIQRTSQAFLQILYLPRQSHGLFMRK